MLWAQGGCSSGSSAVTAAPSFARLALGPEEEAGGRLLLSGFYGLVQFSCLRIGCWVPCSHELLCAQGPLLPNQLLSALVSPTPHPIQGRSSGAQEGTCEGF